MQLLEAVDLSSWHTLASPACGKKLYICQDIQSLNQVPSHAHVLGEGSNTIFLSSVTRPLLSLQLMGKTIVSEDKDSVLLKVMAGEKWADTVAWCVSQGLSGLENLAFIPGTVGAASVQNIGAYGVECASLLDSIEIYDPKDQCLRTLSPKDCDFAYRFSRFKSDWRKYWIVAVTVRLSKTPSLTLGYTGLDTDLTTTQAVFDRVVALRKEKLPDPKEEPNAGSFFHNPIVDTQLFARLHKRFDTLPYYPQQDGRMKVSAAFLLERSGFKGVMDGKVGFSKKHALVLVNHGGTGEEILAFARKVQDEIFKEYHVQLVIEPVVVGGDDETSH